MEDAWEYQDERIEELTDQLGATYSRTFMHATMIAHWATMFHEPVSAMITNFSATLSIAIPTLANIAPLPIFPIASGSSTKPDLKYPSSNNDWEVQSVNNTLALPIPPLQEQIHLEVLVHLHTLHVATPAPPMYDLRLNRKPITPTDPVPSMPSLPPLFLQVDTQERAPSFEQIIDALVQQDVDAQIAHIAREEDEEARTPLLTGPQPGVHPGPGWHVNFEEAAIVATHYFILGSGWRRRL